MPGTAAGTARRKQRSVASATSGTVAWRGHWLYSWDQVLWIAGFFAIELNVKDWRESIEMESQR